MDKLQYDSLYKFFVSLGLVMIILPFAALVYLHHVEPMIISQIEYDALSAYSLQLIENRKNLYKIIFEAIFNLGPFFFLAGCAFVLFGTIKWNGNQRRLDKKLDNETTMQTLSLLEMSVKEVDTKVEKEANEAITESTNDGSSTPVTSQATIMAQYREIENLSVHYFNEKYGHKFGFKRDIQIGKYDYDLIGVSKNDTTDLLVEIKYWRSAHVVTKSLIDVCRHLDGACENYCAIARRDSSGIVFIVTPDEQLSKIESAVHQYTQKALYGASKKIIIMCIGESILR